SYDCSRWMSPYTWGAFFSQVRQTMRGTAADLATAPAIVKLNGHIVPSRQMAKLRYAWTWPSKSLGVSQRAKLEAHATAAYAPSRDAAGYHLRLVGSGGRVVDDRTLEVTETEDGGDADSVGFAVALRAPDEPVSEIQLLDGETLLARRVVGT